MGLNAEKIQEAFGVVGKYLPFESETVATQFAEIVAEINADESTAPVTNLDVTGNTTEEPTPAETTDVLTPPADNTATNSMTDIISWAHTANADDVAAVDAYIKANYPNG